LWRVEQGHVGEHGHGGAAVRDRLGERERREKAGLVDLELHRRFASVRGEVLSVEIRSFFGLKISF
jgi:hypothetical protein